MLLLLSAAFSLAGFREDGLRPKIAGSADLLVVICGFAFAVKPSRFFAVACSLLVLVSFAVYVWSTLDWSGGRDASGLEWLYVVGTLHVLALLLLTAGGVIEGLTRIRRPRG